MFFSDCPEQLFQIFSVKNAVFKYKAGNDHMRSSGFQKIFRILIGNAASNLQSSWIRPKCQHGLLFCFFIKRRIFCIQQNHMSAAYPVFLIHLCKKCRILCRHKIFLCLISFVS